jgi:hypothetical protein
MNLSRMQISQIALLAAFICLCPRAEVAAENGIDLVDVHLRMSAAASHKKLPPAVVWLKPSSETDVPPTAPGRYTLLQKNRTFIPHLLVVPVGSLVLFPNEDPFFHNVFSLFDGKRFDLGLYESGSTKSVDFSREGVSYIFCNIHPEMSAVVIAVSTPYYATADAEGAFEIRAVAAGDYELHVWVEGITQPALESMTRHVHVVPGAGDLGTLNTSGSPREPSQHLNKFGQPYDRDSKPVY